MLEESHVHGANAENVGLDDELRNLRLAIKKHCAVTRLTLPSQPCTFHPTLTLLMRYPSAVGTPGKSFYHLFSSSISSTRSWIPRRATDLAEYPLHNQTLPKLKIAIEVDDPKNETENVDSNGKRVRENPATPATRLVGRYTMTNSDLERSTKRKQANE